MNRLLSYIVLAMACVLAPFAAPTALGQPSGLDRFGVRGAPANRVDASTRIPSHAAEPSLAQAKANAVALNALLTAYRTVEFTEPGDYYFAGEATDYSAIKLPATFRHIKVAAGVRLIRHSAYYGSTPGIGMLIAFSQYTTENEGVRIDGGGTLARMKATVPNNDGMQTNEFCHADLIELRDLTIQTIGASSGGKYGILTSGVDRVILRNIHFKGDETASSHKSDGYHHSGRAGLIDIQGLTGATTDNMVGVGIDEGANYLASVPAGFQGGTIDKVVARDISPTLTQAEPIRFFGWATANLNISGADYSEPGGVFTIFKATAFTSILHFKSAVAAGNITLTLNVTGGAGITPATYTIASIVDANTITLTADAGSSTSDLTATTVTNNAKFRNIHVNGLNGSVAAAVTSGASCAWDNGLTDGVMENVLFENISISGGAASGSTANVVISAGGAQRVVVRNVRPQGDGSHGHDAVKVFNTAAALRYLEITDCHSVLPAASTASAHLIEFVNSANGGAITLRELRLANNSITVNNNSNASALFSTDALGAGALTINRWSGTNNAYTGSGGSTTQWALQLANNTANVVLSGHEAGFYVKDAYGLLDAGNVSAQLRSRFHFEGLNVVAQATHELVRGKVDVTSANLTATANEIVPCGNASGSRTGSATWSHAPQWSAINLTYVDFQNLGATATGNLNLNTNATVTRFNKVLGQGYIVRGGNVQFGIMSHYNVAGQNWTSSGTMTTATISLGNVEDTAYTKYSAAYNVLAANNGLAKTLTITSAGNSIENVAASKDIGMQLLLSGASNTCDNLTAGTITGWLQWSFTQKAD